MKSACLVNLHHAVTVSQQRLGKRVAQLSSARMNEALSTHHHGKGCPTCRAFRQVGTTDDDIWRRLTHINIRRPPQLLAVTREIGILRSAVPTCRNRDEWGSLVVKRRQMCRRASDLKEIHSRLVTSGLVSRIQRDSMPNCLAYSACSRCQPPNLMASGPTIRPMGVPLSR